MRRQSIEQGSFILLLVAVTVAFGLVVANYSGAIFAAVIFALIFLPLHRLLLKWTNGRKNLAAAGSLLFCLLLAIIPMIIITAAIIQEAHAVYLMFVDPETGKVNLLPYVERVWNALPEVIRGYVQEFFNGESEFNEILNQFGSVASAGASTIGKATKTVMNWGQSAFGVIVAFCVMLYLLFFLFRDGEQIAVQMARYIPLSEEYKKHLFEKFAMVVKATVKGNVVIAIIQGMLGGLAFYFFDIQGALLWAVLMAILSLLPAVGASLVWMPVAIYFFATGKILSGIMLTAYGMLVIGLVDNLLRPILVGKDTKLPDYIILISTLGGISLVGLSGFIVGPLIAALFFAAWGLLEDEKQKELFAEQIKFTPGSQEEESEAEPLEAESNGVEAEDRPVEEELQEPDHEQEDESQPD